MQGIKTLLLAGMLAFSLPGAAQDLSGLPMATLKRQFSDPGKDYGSAPLWVWNTKVTKGLIDTALQAFKDNAFGGVFVHPRAGLITEYLSPEWFGLWAYATQKAKSLGLNIWIYDEDSYPSGFAGGHVPATMPSSYNQGEMLQMDTSDVLPANAADYFLHLKRDGKYYLFKKTNYYTSPWYGGYSYVDLMAPGVTDSFIRKTMTGYEKAVGAEFGKTLKGIFSDEPNIEVQYPNSIRWTPGLFSAFEASWHYRLQDSLPSLLKEVGDWKKIRHDYYETLLQLFINGWSKPYSTYAAGKGLEWTGHYWEHEWPSPNHVPDNMAMYAWPQRPGIDLLFNQFDEHNVNAQFGNIRAVKELASVANQLGKSRTLCETYGGGGWDLRFRDMKRLGDWAFTLGINTLDQHLSFMTITGARKYDYPQSFSYHTPWWPDYKYLNRYFTRLSWALTRGEQRNPVLVLEPTTTAWMYAAYDVSDKRLMDIGSHFQSFVTHLEAAQVEYDLGSEAIIRDHGSVEGLQFIIGKRAYSTIVIPPGTENLDASTDALLRRFAAAGGKILQYETIQRIDGAAVPAPVRYAGSNVLKLDTATFGFGHPWLNPEGLTLAMDSGSRGDLHHQRRMLNGKQFLFLSNASIKDRADGTFTLPGSSIQRMDLFTGDVSPFPCVKENGSVKGTFHLDAEGSLLLLVSDSGQAMPPGGSMKVDTVSSTPLQAIRPTRNTLMIDFCDVRIGDTVLTDKHVFDAADTVFKHFGFTEGNPWNTSIQFERNTVSRDTFRVKSGFAATYRFYIDGGMERGAIQAVVEQPALWHVSVNGHAVEAIPGQWWLDRAWGVYAIGRNLHAGDNEITVKANRMSVFAEIEPVYILGNFSLDPADKGWRITAPRPLDLGSWKTQGLPMYGEDVRYEKDFTVNAEPGRGSHLPGGRYLLQLGTWNGTVSSVSVNDHEAGIIAFAPDTLDIGALVHPGVNHLVITVKGSLKNLLGPHHNHPPAGIASPWHWRNVKGYPSGDAYDTIDYGLMEDVLVLHETP